MTAFRANAVKRIFGNSEEVDDRSENSKVIYETKGSSEKHILVKLVK